MSDSRKRRAAAKAADRVIQPTSALPSSSYFLGYVDDDEPVEMIMKKFEIMQQLQERGKAETPPVVTETVTEVKDTIEAPEVEDLPVDQLSQEQQEELFKMTSTFTVRSMMRPEEYAALDRMIEEDGLLALSDDELDQWGLEYDEDELGGRKRRRGRGPIRGVKHKRTVVEDLYMMQINKYGRQVRVLIAPPRRKEPRDIYGVMTTRQPNPLPVSWASIPRPYKPAGQKGNTAYVELAIDKAAIQGLGKVLKNEGYRDVYDCVLVDAPWKEGEGLPVVTKAQYRSLRLDKLVPHGFACVWVYGNTMEPVFEVMAEQGFYYVENMVWAWTTPHHRRHVSGGNQLQHSKQTMLIFRRTAHQGQQIELRHQRSADVVCSAVPKSRRKPEHAMRAIEILLPDAYMPDAPPNQAKLLHLWADGCGRKGWVSVAYKV